MHCHCLSPAVPGGMESIGWTNRRRMRRREKKKNDRMMRVRSTIQTAAELSFNLLPVLLVGVHVGGDDVPAPSDRIYYYVYLGLRRTAAAEVIPFATDFLLARDALCLSSVYIVQSLNVGYCFSFMVDPQGTLTSYLWGYCRCTTATWTVSDKLSNMQIDISKIKQLTFCWTGRHKMGDIEAPPL